MEKRNTSFGSLEPLLVRDGEVISELATFNSNGKAHAHDKAEHCYVLSGKGRIIEIYKNTELLNQVEKGDFVEIDKNSPHWMEVDKGDTMEILLVYSDND